LIREKSVVIMRARPRGCKGHEGKRGLGEIEGKQGKGLHRPFFCGAPPNGRIKLYGTSMWCDIPAKADDQSGWDKWSPTDKSVTE